MWPTHRQTTLVLLPYVEALKAQWQSYLPSGLRFASSVLYRRNANL